MNLDHLYQNYGRIIISLWAFVLGAQNAGTLLILSASVQGNTLVEASIWFRIYQVASVGFTLAFIAAAVGLWQYRNWGRRLFLVTAVVFFMVSLIGIFTLQQGSLSTGETWFQSFRYIISTLLPLAYLNLPNVKAKFQEI